MPQTPFTTQVFRTEKRTKYIPVAEATFGGTPKESNAGLMITAPPRPRAPATKPPVNPTTNKRVSDLLSKITSLSTKLMLYFLRRILFILINLDNEVGDDSANYYKGAA